MKLSIASSLAIFSLPCLVSAQLSGDVGPSTSASTKSASKTCNVLDYGGVASTTSDLGPPLASAWAACKENGMGKFSDSDHLDSRLTSWKSTYLLEATGCRPLSLLLEVQPPVSNLMVRFTALGQPSF